MNIQTTLAQLNTNPAKIKAMVGGQCLVIENGLQINFKGSKKADRVQITLENDEYTLRFYKLSRKTFNCPLVKEYVGIQAANLYQVWYNFTGLDNFVVPNTYLLTSLFKVRY